MYNNCVSVFKTVLYTIVSVAKEYILIAVAINYQTGAKARDYIEEAPWTRALIAGFLGPS